MAALSVTAGIIAVANLAIADASAHQSGCHRWHTCPSDTGSYVCGDLGYPCQTSATPPPSTPPAVPYSDKNCADFPNQQAAQDFYNAHPGDPSRLDADNDAIACESNPCACSPAAAPPPPQPTTPAQTDPATAACTKSKRAVTRLKGLVAGARERLAKARGRTARRRAAKRLRKLRSDLALARIDMEDDCSPV
jgi:hypothetical protein